MSADTTSPRLVIVHPDADSVALAAAERLLLELMDVQAVRENAHVVLTGGTVGIKTLAKVAESPLRDLVDWTHVHLWWGDERFLPAGDADRNEVQAHEALIDTLPIPAAHVHVIAAQSDSVPDAETAATTYADELARFAPDGDDVPLFDVLLLGMGPDAHVASLFPGHEGLSVAGQPTAPVHDSPKPPSDRVTLTFEAINAARQVWIVAAGAEKAGAVAASLGGAPVNQAPAGHVAGTDRTLWLVDVAATGIN